MRVASLRTVSLSLAALTAVAVAAPCANAASQCTAAITVHYAPALHTTGATAGDFTGFGNATCTGTVSGSQSLAENGSRGPGVCGSDQGDGTLSLGQAGIASFHYVNTGLVMTLTGSTPQGDQLSGRLDIPFSATAACGSAAGLAGTTVNGTLRLTGG